MLIKLNVDQVRVVGLWGFADMGPGRHRDGPTRGLAETGWADTGPMPATQSRKLENKSNEMRI